MRLTSVLLLFILVLVSGCATTLTEEEATAACPEQEEECLRAALEKKVDDIAFDREYAEAERQDLFCLQAVQCKAQGGHIYTTQRGPGSRSIGTCQMDRKIKILRRNQTWQCLSDAGLQELLNQVMRGYY